MLMPTESKNCEAVGVGAAAAVAERRLGRWGAAPAVTPLEASTLTVKIAVKKRRRRVGCGCVLTTIR